MSANDLAIRSALENRLTVLAGELDVAFENEKYSPDVARPYLKATLMPIDPDDSTMSSKFVIERGIFHVAVNYPPLMGVGDALRTAMAIKDGFSRASSLVSDGVTVTIIGTPAVGQGQEDVDGYRIPVRIKYQSQNLNP